jgi:hypothetical protein
MTDTLVDKILGRMQTITLDEMGRVHLMDRVDFKFVASTDVLPELLEEMIPYFKVQVTEGKRVASYSTQYLDTPGLDFFRMHQEGKLNRQKIRIRSYIDSHVSFLEVKNRNGDHRTRKIRVPVELSHIQSIDEIDACLPFLEKYAIFDSHRLTPALVTTFDRITLVNMRSTERVTIDRNLSFVNYRTGKRATDTRLLILELKQEEWQLSDLRDIMDRFKIAQAPFSKYCVGMALTDSEAKSTPTDVYPMVNQ